MMNPNIEISGQLGATRAAWRVPGTLQNMFKKLFERLRNESREDQLEQFLIKVKGRNYRLSAQSEAWIDEGMTYFFKNHVKYVKKDLRDDEEQTSSRSDSIEAAETRAAQIAATETVTTAMERRFRAVLLDLPMFNGKTLRDCTFAEAGQAGGWLSKVATHGEPDAIIGEHLNEAELNAILDEQ